MISIIQGAFDLNNAKLLGDLFAKRHELFVEGRGWRALARPDKLDIDQYDDEHTIYFIKQINGAIVGGARLRPTILRHMLKEVFGDLCEGGCPPLGPRIYECSRTFVARRHPDRRAIFAELLLNVAQYCVARDVDTLTGVLETWWLNSYLALGLNAVPLGMPQELEGMSLLAVSFKVDAEVRDNLSARLATLVKASKGRENKPRPLQAA
jgi:acyl-homoserine lactone synthase